MRRIMAFAVMALVLSGCAGMRDVVDNDLGRKLNDTLNQWSCGKDLDCVQAFNEDAQLRQLRAHLLISMFARYGAARLPQYSEDLPNDAAKLLARIEHAEDLLRTARRTDGDLKGEATKPDVRAKAALYPIVRAEAILAVVSVADTATRPTRKNLFGFMTVKSMTDRIIEAPALLSDALRNLLYLEAYDEVMKNLRRLAKDSSPVAAGPRWGALDTDLKASCDVLKVHANVTAHRCIPELE